MSGLRGFVVGSLALAVVEAFVTPGSSASATAAKQGRISSLFLLPGALARRFVDPTVPLFGPSATAATSSSATQTSIISPTGDTADTSFGGQTVALAQAEIGKPYQWGATGPDAFDCSGLVQSILEAQGVAEGRTTYNQIGEGAPVASLGAAVPGDLVFFNEGSGNPPEHVGIYAGNGQMIDAPDTGGFVRQEPVWQSELMAIRRPGPGATQPTDTQGVFV